MKSKFVIFFIVCFTVLPVSASSASENMENLVEKYVAGMNVKNLPETMSCFHSSSPAYAPTSQMLQQFFLMSDSETSLIDFSYIGESGGYAIALVTTKLTRKGGAPIMEGKSTTIFAYKKEGALWKFWAYLAIDFQPLR